MNFFPKISIIILNWNNYKNSKECLRSLFKIETYPNKEVIVVDNGSIDNSTQRLQKEFPQCIFIYNKKNLGFATGNNQGIKYALENQTDYIFLLNNDTIFVEPILKKMIKFAENDKKIGIIGPKLISKNGDIQESARRQITFLNFIIDLIGFHKILIKYNFKKNKIQNVGYVSGAAFLIKVLLIKKIGLLDERFFFYAEDRDWCQRAKKINFKTIYFPNAKTIHIGGVSGNHKMMKQQQIANIQFFKKYHPIIPIVFIKLIISITSIERFIIGFFKYIFSKKEADKVYMKNFLNLSFNIWKLG